MKKYIDIDSDCSDADEDPACDCCNFSMGQDENFVELDDFGDGKFENSFVLFILISILVDTVFVITQGKILDQLKLREGLDGRIVTAEGVIVESNDDSCEIILSYKYMRENVFDQITDNVIEFVRTQMKKIGGNITRTYLAGGSGEIPYIKKRLLNEFSSNSPFYLGSLVSDYRAMQQ